MEYVLNWLVLLLSLGGIALVAIVCYADMVRGAARAPAPAPTAPEESAASQSPSRQAAGPFLELTYCRDGAAEHVQRVPMGQTGYIGTESYAGLGGGMPVRGVEVIWRDGRPRFCNLDWQTEVLLRNAQGAQIEAPMAQELRLDDGAELCLPGGWTIQCRICEGGEE